MATGPDTSISLLTLADAAEYLGDTGTTGNWGKIADLINYVSARMNAECGRALKSDTHTEYYDGNGEDWLLLNHWPLASTSITITIDDSRAYTTTYQVTGTDIMLDTEMGRVRLDGDEFDEGEKNVKVAYTAGYSTASEFALVGAAKEYLQLMWNRATKRDTVGLRTESFEGGSKTYEGDLPWSVRKVLDMYRDRRVS